ncbi:MAG: hypothetical protein K5695_11970, partial [Oscillospiraceae bacterium]|nr:hypothetical protein [Oscillospiraceae bacterium]
MKLMQKLFPPPPVTDEIPDKIHKRLHIIYFIMKCLAGVLVFLFLYLFASSFLHMIDSDVPESGTADSPFLRHEYCGTFFVEINAENSFPSQEAYEAYMSQKAEPEPDPTPLQTGLNCVGWALEAVMIVLCMIKKQVTQKIPERTYRYVVLGLLFAGCWLVSLSFMTAMTVMLLVLLFLAFRSGDRKTIFCERSSDYFLIGGLLWLCGNLYMDIEAAQEMYEHMASYLVGTFGHPQYYCMLYNLVVIPLILFSGGLMLRRHELDLKQAKTANNTSLLKATGYSLSGGTAAFILYRMGVRVYELVRVLRGDAYNVKLAFTVMDVPYNRLIELPQELANTPEDYRNVVLFRFVKDFPVAVVAALAVYCFVKVLFA